MRVQHTLWKVSNGWLLVPEDCNTVVNSKDAPRCTVFKSLKEFSDWRPRRERKHKPHMITIEDKNNANIN